MKPITKCLTIEHAETISNAYSFAAGTNYVRTEGEYAVGTCKRCGARLLLPLLDDEDTLPFRPDEAGADACSEAVKTALLAHALSCPQCLAVAQEGEPAQYRRMCATGAALTLRAADLDRTGITLH